MRKVESFTRRNTIVMLLLDITNVAVEINAIMLWRPHISGTLGLGENPDSCQYKSMQDNQVAVDEGNDLGLLYWITLDACKTFCRETEGCNSFAHCHDSSDTGNCWIKDKTLLGNETTREHDTCTTYYSACEIMTSTAPTTMTTTSLSTTTTMTTTSFTETTPETTPETEPETSPETEPETSPETEPETSPETEPDTSPETEPETSPETEPQTSPETEPETSPETKPETSPETEPETSPETKPETSPETEPAPKSTVVTKKPMTTATPKKQNSTTPKTISSATTTIATSNHGTDAAAQKSGQPNLCNKFGAYGVSLVYLVILYGSAC